MIFTLSNDSGALLTAETMSWWNQRGPVTYFGDTSLLAAAPEIAQPVFLSRLFAGAAAAKQLKLGGDFEQHRLHGRYATPPP